MATIPNGTKLGTEESVKINLQTSDGGSYSDLLSNFENGSKFQPSWKVSKGSEFLNVSDSGIVTPIKPGDATIEAKIPGLAAKSGFLFIKALGKAPQLINDVFLWSNHTANSFYLCIGCYL